MMLEVSRHPWNHQHNWCHKHIHHFHSLIFNVEIVTHFFLLLASYICARLKWSNHLIVPYKVCKSSILSLQDNCNNCLSIVTGDQSWVFIGRTDAEAETPVFGHLMRRTDSFENTLMLRKIEGRRRRWQQRMRWLNGITDSVDMSLSERWTGQPGVLQSMGSQRVRHDWATELIDSTNNIFTNLTQFSVWSVTFLVWAGDRSRSNE